MQLALCKKDLEQVVRASNISKTYNTLADLQTCAQSLCDARMVYSVMIADIKKQREFIDEEKAKYLQRGEVCTIWCGVAVV